MNKQVFDNSDSQLPQGWQASSGDEIDLRELILVLWRGKVLILLITVLFAAVGVGYALTAPQQWSAKQGEIVNILLKIKNSFLPTKQILIGL